MKFFVKNRLVFNKLSISIIMICILFLTGLFMTKDLKESYSLLNDGNIMNIFPSAITSQKDKIVEVYFINDTQENIDTRYNTATIKAELTYYSTGSVKGWLEPSSDSSKYILYVGSTGETLLNTGLNLFNEWTNLKKIDFGNVNTSQVTTMHNMFMNCTSLSDLNLEKLDTSQVTNMGGMFYGCSSLTSLDLSSFNTGNVTDMSYMFSECSSLTTIDISSFNTSKVKNTKEMFNNCKALTSINLQNFDTSNITDMSSMFANCLNLEKIDLNSFNTSNVTNMKSMFYNCSNLKSIDLSKFNTSNVTDMAYMFYRCKGLTKLDLSNFDTSKVSDMSFMFYECSGLTSLELSNFNTGQVTNMKSMFYGCEGLAKLDLSSFNTSNVTDMSYMFANNTNLVELNNSGFDMSKVTQKDSMYDGCTKLNSEGLSKDNTLSSLKIDGESVSKFNSNTTSYSKTVKSNKSSVTISATSTNSKAKVSGAGNHKLNYGVNTIKVIVTSESGATKEYVIKITRESSKSSVNTLKELTLSSGQLDFNANSTEYDVIVPNDVTKITIKSKLTDSKASYVSGSSNIELNLMEGTNKVLIKVKAENGDVKTYTINIRREASFKNIVSDITIDNYTIDFLVDTLEYNLEIRDETSLKFNVTLTNSTYSYEIINNDNLMDGSIIIVRATGNNETIEYKFNITKKIVNDNEVNNNDPDNSNNYKTYLFIGFMVLAIVILVSSVIYIVKKNKNKVIK